MKLKKIILAVVAGIALCGSLIFAPAMAEVKSFSAIDGIEAQALTATEMDAIHGEGARLDALIASLLARQATGFPILEAKYPIFAARLSAGLDRLIVRLQALAAR